MKLMRPLRRLLRRGNEERQRAKLRAELATFSAPEDRYVLILWAGFYARLIETELERRAIPASLAYTDDEALAKIALSRPAVVVCYASEEPQRAGGPRLIAEIREDPDLEALPIVVFARPGEEKSVDAARHAGAADCYGDAGDLIRAIQRLLA